MISFIKFIGICSIGWFMACDPTTSSLNEINTHHLGNQLEKAYQSDSEAMLKDFFKTWKAGIPAYSDVEIADFSKEVRQVYAIFKEFYSPTDLGRITNGTHENFETQFKYIVVQNQLNYAIVDTNPDYYFYEGVEKIDKKISDFRPPCNDLDLPVVYLTDEMDSLIYAFFFDEGTAKDDFGDRVDFLRQFMQLTHHHWVPEFHKATMPNISTIIFNETFDKARVSFRVFYQFGHANLDYENGRWVLKESKLTAIE